MDLNSNKQNDGRRAFVILNPVAGNGAANRARELLQRQFTDRCWSSEFFETTGAEDIAEVVRNSIRRDFDIIVAAGGDGTVSSVVDGLVQSNALLAILPLGTGNILAQELGIPLDLEEACRLVVGKHGTKWLDVMQVGNRACISHISMGVYALIANETGSKDKHRFGRLAYLWTGLKKLIDGKQWKFELTVDDQNYHIWASSVLVANAGAVGISSLRWGRNIRPDDGELNICIVRSRTVADYLSTVWNALLKQHRSDRNIQYLIAKNRIKIQANHRLPVRADGEIVGDSLVNIRMVPKAVQVIIGSTSDNRPC